MLSINIDDALNVLKLASPYLIFFGVVLVLAIVAMIIARRFSKAKKYLVRAQSGVAIVLALVIALNLIAFGPMSTLITLVTGTGAITPETSSEAEALATEIGNEGITLLNNEDNLLPYTDGGNINVFGWGSTNPVYGGTGSG